jgi:predicted transcriptional regulator of viral defense system
MHKLSKLPNNINIIKTRDSKSFNLNRTDLYRLSKIEQLEHVSRGIYITPEEIEKIPFEISDLIYNTLSIKHGVIFGLSALAYYKLTDEIPRMFYIAIPYQNKPSKNKSIRFYRLKNHSLGIEELKITENISVNIYSKEKTIVDAFKFLTLETAIKALKIYLNDNENVDINKILEYSRILKVKMEPYLETLLINDR